VEASKEIGTMKRSEVAATGLFMVLAWSAGGCSKSDAQRTAPTAAATPTPAVVPPSPPADPASDAKALFKLKCVVCHGDHGAGDGPGAAAIVPKPRAFADAEWQTTVTDEHLKRIILEGGPAVGKSPAMPPNPDLKGKDDVVLALVKLIRDFKK
jgi:mono/diheme cytochrome c family protein